MAKKPRAFHETKKGQDINRKDGDDDADADKEKEKETPREKPKHKEPEPASPAKSPSSGPMSEDEAPAPLASLSPSSASAADASSSTGGVGDELSPLERMKKLAAQRASLSRAGKPMRGPSISGGKKEQPTSPVVKAGKRPTIWADQKLTKEQVAALDFTSKVSGGAGGQNTEEAMRAQAREMYGEAPKMGDRNFADGVEGGDNDDDDDDEDDDDDVEIKKAGDQAKPKSSGFFSFFKKLTGNKPLDKADLEPVSWDKAV